MDKTILEPILEEAQRWKERAKLLEVHLTLAEAEIERSNGQLLGACEAALNLLINADFNFANGNVYNGIDEGEVRGMEYLKEVTTLLSEALKSKS